jgi:hypothetical protein
VVYAEKLCCGLRVMMLSAPAVELRPYSVPCGPYSTSMRSRSNISNVIIAIEATYTWSI